MAHPKLAPLRDLARLAYLSFDELYRKFRLPEAPAPRGHVAGIPVFDVEEGLRFLGLDDDEVAAALGDMPRLRELPPRKTRSQLPRGYDAEADGAAADPPPTPPAAGGRITPLEGAADG